ncbi:MAG: tRNA pseudouridine(38-40) synthase TruA [Bacteroidales bacterium]|nr:tRNA pseudouridine(38-40) synthase TruA [Bacteroidales bacterium]
MQRYFLKLAYNGAAYHGWQFQPNAVTIQQVLEQALSMFLRDTISLIGCGRTDAGVHAAIYYAHFDTEALFDEPLLVKRLNAFLRKDIFIYDCFKVSPDLHARFSALYRTYHYHIITRKDPFRQEFTCPVYRNLDFDTMNAAAAALPEYTDFSAFSKSHTDTKTNNCMIMNAVWEQTETEHVWVFKITANRFLRNMVRAIVGTLLEVGYGNISLQTFRDIIESKSRQEAATSAPAEALFLWDVGYEW